MDRTFWFILVLNIFFFSFLSSLFYWEFSSVVPSLPIKEDELWNLTIIHTNDVHSRYDQINSAFTECTKEQFKEGKCYGGTARHKTVIDRLRRENKNSLLLDGGDQFQGKKERKIFFSKFNLSINFFFF